MNVNFRPLIVLVLASGFSGCAKNDSAPPAQTAAPSKHEHHPPHAGTPVVLGAELYHLELVRDAGSGRLSAYVLDGEMEGFVRIAQPTIELSVSAGAGAKSLVLTAVANPATGETAGSTALFEGQADWLKTTAKFDAVISRVEIKGNLFTAVPFNFPQGNDRD